MENEIFVDTSVFYAFLDKDDKEHKKVKKIFKQYENKLITSNYIIDEFITLLRVRKIPFKKFEVFIDEIFEEDILKVLKITVETEIAAWNLLKKYKEHPFSFTDCTSFVLMNKNKIKSCLSFDKHFVIAGFLNLLEQ